ncbi:MAG: S41 family peptidase [Oleispira antarctica]|uniref:Peptidase S41A, family protein n=1 Tax=Oleispira antarctica RB-8 TaxID=698738 RepID=R4YJM5_OLEAN|nr:S41 family peptidase [Oleispira antarctica]MBQ0792259.1 S41 family peptidase [Oleispira antarctica]CCK74526.1 Peptidase S41A, family protein [Oleispira antarctica RB-8]
MFKYIAFSTLLIGSQFLTAKALATEEHENADNSDIQQRQLPLQELRNFTEIFDRIRTAYVEPVDDKTLLQYAIDGMLSNLDPHSDYLLPEDFSELQEHTTGKFGGLGIEVGIEEGLIKVVSPIDDTPAEKAGIKSGDFIVSLDGEPVREMSLNNAIDKMRGEPGTDIALSIRREGEQELLEFILTRAEIKVASVRGESLGDGIGYLRITQFQDQSGPELIEAITKLQKKAQDNKEQLNGLVLDLRNNPGGVLDAAVEVSDAFLNSGLIVYTEGRISESDFRYSATENTIAEDIPLIVLINGGSASASEIVAGALQDHKRAVVVGTQSFGKGSVQSVLPIADNKAIKLTTARYFTPNGRSIQAQGIKPDVFVEQSEVTTYEQSYYKESDLSGHLSNGNGEEKPAGSNEGDHEVSDNLLSKDFQLYQAYTLLKGWSVFQHHAKPVAQKMDILSEQSDEIQEQAKPADDS